MSSHLPSIQYFGQAGYVFTSASGATLAVDLYLSDSVEKSEDGFKRLCPKLLKPEETCFDYVAATHWHLDHFDIDAMPTLFSNERSFLIAAKDCEKLASFIPADRKAFLAEGDCFEAGDFFVRAVFCDHGAAAPQAIGLVIEFDGLKTYIAGDTSLRLDKAEEIACYGEFDLMIAPINGAFGNLSEKEAAELCAFHKPKVFIPSHYWMFAEHHGDPGMFIQEIHRLDANQKYHLMCPGERYYLKG